MPRELQESRRCVLTLMRRLRAMPDVEYLQSVIAYHAAPTLLGIKPATLICPDATGRNLGQALKECVPCLARIFGVEVTSFRNRAGALLFLIYNPSLLAATLSAREAAELLTEAGYDSGAGDVDRLLATLGGRCAGRRFPHEIGVFLGYPPCDVRGFMRSGGCGARRDGACWRAYANRARARRCSERFRDAKLRAAELIVGGADLRRLAEGLRGVDAA